MRDPFSGYDQWKTASPYDDDDYCEVCAKEAGDCICPECWRCGTAGDPDCYISLTNRSIGHGLVRSRKQRKSFQAAEEFWEAQNRGEAEYWESRRHEH